MYNTKVKKNFYAKSTLKKGTMADPSLSFKFLFIPLHNIKVLCKLISGFIINDRYTYRKEKQADILITSSISNQENLTPKELF